MNELKLTGFTRLRNTVGYVHQKNNNQHQGCGNLCIGDTIPKIAHFSNPFSHQTVINKKIVPNIILRVNTKTSDSVEGNEIVYPIKGTASHAADILIESPEKALSQGFVNNLSIEDTVLSDSPFVNDEDV